MLYGRLTVTAPETTQCTTRLVAIGVNNHYHNHHPGVNPVNPERPGSLPKRSTTLTTLLHSHTHTHTRERRELSDDAVYNNGHDLRRPPTPEAAGVVPLSRSVPLTTNQQLAPPPWRTNIRGKKMQQRAGDANNDNQSQTPYKVVIEER